MRAIRILFPFIALLYTAPALTATVNVPGDQPTIQAGIDAAIPGDTVLVADGVYTGDGNRDIDLLGKWLVIRSANGPENCIIDCEGGEGDFHRAFIFHSHESTDTVVRGFTIRHAYADWSDEYDGEGGGILCHDASPVIENCRFVDCTAGDGAGIACVEDAAPIINGCRFEQNFSNNGAAGIYVDDAHPTITDCVIIGNEARWATGILCRNADITISGCRIESNLGGGLGAEFCDTVITGCSIINNSDADGSCGGLAVGGDGMALLENCVIAGNSAGRNGGGLCLIENVTVRNCLVVGNHADGEGGGISADYDTTATMINCTVAGNSADQGGGAYASNYGSGVDLVTMVNCVIRENSGDPIFDFYGTAPVITYSNVQGGYAGSGNIDADPLFATGPHGDHYLGQVDAGQAADSPCVDAGDPSSDPVGGTTRTDSGPDTGIIDIGCHAPIWDPAPCLVTGPGPGYDNPPLVRVFPAEEGPAWFTSFHAYGASRYGVNVAAGDIDGDGADELITGGGPGAVYGPHVRGFQVRGTAIADLSFLAYGTNKFGVNVAAGNLDADGFDEIITGAGPGAVFGPHVRGWNYDGTGPAVPMAGASYFAYGTPKWGVNVGCGDIDGDGFDEIVTGAGPGAIYGPHVRGWNVDGGPATAMPEVSFLAYGTNRMGVNVACGDVDGDGIDEIVTGPGPSSYFAAHVRGWNVGGGVTAIGGINFFAWEPGFCRYGARICCRTDLDGDGNAEIVVGPGPDPAVGTPVKAYRFTGGQVNAWLEFPAYPSAYDRGTNVAAGRF